MKKKNLLKRICAGMIGGILCLLGAGCLAVEKGDYKITFSYGYGADKTYETVWLNDGEELIPPKKSPKREGYKFCGWDYDFKSYVYSDLKISAKWMYYGNKTLDFEKMEQFPAKIRLTEAAGGKQVINYDASIGHKVLISRADNKTIESILSIDFNETLPNRTKIFFTAKYEYNEEETTGGMSVLIDGDFWKPMGKVGEYQEYVYEMEETRNFESISFRPLSQATSYTVTISELHIISNMEDVDFEKNEYYTKALLREWRESESSFVYEEEISRKVFYFKAIPTNPYHYFGVDYTGDLVVPAGAKVHMYIWYKAKERNGLDATLEVGLNSEGNYTGSEISCFEREKWHDYILEFSKETELKRISLRPWGSGMTIEIKVARIWIEYP